MDKSLEEFKKEFKGCPWCGHLPTLMQQRAPCGAFHDYWGWTVFVQCESVECQVHPSVRLQLGSRYKSLKFPWHLHDPKFKRARTNLEKTLRKVWKNAKEAWNNRYPS